MKTVIFTILFGFTFINVSFCQELLEGQKRWSSENKLKKEDYKIKVNNINNDIIYTQITISHKVSGFDFFKKNFNKNVENIFLGNASWIDSTKIKNLNEQIEFQQLQFDLAEVEARKFRKEILKNRKQIAKGFNIINQISNDILAEFSEVRLQIMLETESGENKQKIFEWKEKIAAELIELNDFSYENNKKIHLNK
ncbi:hypothetical protein ACFQ5N_14155 [Lutibacter holmesii]|uniref:Uncharacterized protein n=1 Tax=Lutibacter holmesii TaxID=1137985 RepID=A0ABW3WTI1_9FLAO